jgi:hypothetical protein
MVAVGLFLALLPAPALAEPVTPFPNNGPQTNRVNVVILGDGYTAGEMSDYVRDVDILVDKLFEEDPFREYRRYFNVYRVDGLVSDQQGAADRPYMPGDKVKTALGAYFYCDNVTERLLCVDESLVYDVLFRSNILHPDVIVVVVNEPHRYGGSGGPIPVTSTEPRSPQILMHELGHSFGNLADEYESDSKRCNRNEEPPEVNVTMVGGPRESIKWGQWIDEERRQLPSEDTIESWPGAYRGAKYCSPDPSQPNLFRPTYNSKMRSLTRPGDDRPVPWDQINSEQLVKQVYGIVFPIDQADPPTSTVHLKQGQVRRFSVQTPRPMTHPLTFAWRVDGGTLLSRSTYLDVPGNLSPGSHTIEVTVEDPTEIVHPQSDRTPLRETHAWTVVVEARMADLVVTAVTSPGTAAAGGALAVTDAVRNAGDGTAAASTTRHYLSADRTKDPGDALLTPGQILGRLLPGQTVTLASVVTVPPTTALGSYFLISCADDLDVVPESDESNNCQAIPVTIVLPRLATVTAFTGSATGVGTGSSFVRINGRFTVPGDLDLRTSVAVLSSVLGTSGGVGDLVGGAPFSLVRNVIRSATVARFETAPGARPFARLEIRARGGNAFDVLIEVSITIVARPSRCPAELTTSFALGDAANPPLRVATGRVWQCVSSSVLRSP